MGEGKYQAKVIKSLESKGWYVIKNMRTNKNGFPDLTAFKPRLPPLFVEVKLKTGRLSKLQEFRIKELRKKGFKVLVIWQQ
jgi:Holliday junction resolvase